MLAFEAQVSAQEGNVGLPYVSHDIGSFHGQPVSGQCGQLGTSALSAHLPDDLYARWVALGTFQPLDRLHSDHGDRLPWQYGAAANTAAAGFLRLREALNPYIYTLARRAYDSGLPLTGSLYVQWPGAPGAYEHPSEYTFGRDIVVAPVAAAGDPAPATIWVPPGTWIDYFTGRRYHGPSVQALSVPLSQMPVLVRAGAIVPTEPYQPFTRAAPQSTLILTAYPGARGRFSLYDDAGSGFGYSHGRFAWMPISHRQRGRVSVVRIGPASGRFAGAPQARRWIVRFVGVRRPRSVRVNAHVIRRGRWSYDRATRTVTVTTGAMATRRMVTVSVR